MSPGLSKVWIGVAGWAVGAATATAVGLFALSAIDLGPANKTSIPQPLETVHELADGRAVSALEQTPTPSPSAAPDGPVERVLTSPGGSVVARCTAAGAYLVSWSPAQGFKAEEVRRGPATAAKVEFEHHDGGRSVLTVRCLAGVPQASVSRDG